MAAAGPVARALDDGRVLYQEPGLAELVTAQRRAGRLDCRTDEPGLADPNGEPAVSEPASVVCLALQPGDFGRAEHLAAWAGRGGARLLINQSVFPVGSTEQLQTGLREQGAATPVVCLPDTLQEGMALASFTRPHHLLLGCDDREAEVTMRELLRPYNRRRDVLQVMQPREAEFTKVAISGMLATRLSYMNDMALLAEELGVDIDVIRQGVGSDPRIGEAYLYAGCGFGGPGFSRDVMNLTDTLRRRRVGAELLEQVLQINERQKEVLFRKFWRHYDGEVDRRRVTLWGAAFKPGSDRVDNGPALRLIEALWAQGVDVHVHDPWRCRSWPPGPGTRAP